MPLPIAVGGVSLSSERLKGPYQPPPSESGVAEQIPYQSVTWTACPRDEWQARTVLSFYDEDNEGNNSRRLPQQHHHQCKRNRRRLVEIRVQISPLVSALSPKAYRETRYHLELFTFDDHEDDHDDGDNNSCSSSHDYDDESFCSESQTDDEDHPGNPRQQIETHRQPQVVFSQDRRHLMVLLFHNKSGNRKHPGKIQQQRSAIIVFQLRKPKSTANSSINDRSKIPLPSYIAKATLDSSGGSDPNNTLLAVASNPIGGSPAVATHPKFIPSCKGITAICCLAGEPTNPGGSRRRPTEFLAVESDGTLNWVNARSAQVTTTAALPVIQSNNCFVASMKASPASTLDKGMVALVIASSNSSFSPTSNSSQSSQSLASHVTDSDGDDFDGIASSIESISSSDSGGKKGGIRVTGGECVLVEWSKMSTTSNPLQSTNEYNNDENQTLDAAAEEQQDRLRQKEHMDQFVLQELQKKHLASPRLPSSSSIPIEEGKDRASDEQSPMAVTSRSILPQQQSSAENEKLSGISSGMMHVGLRSVWSPPSGSDENNEARVTDAAFGSLPSVLCVVYTHTNRRELSLGPRQKMAQVLILSDSNLNESSKYCDLVPTVSLYLSPDQVEQAPSVAKIDHKTNYHSDQDNDDHDYYDEKDSECETSVDELSNDEESQERRKDNPFSTMIESRLVGIQHDPGSDSFVISSIFRGNRGTKDHWVGCVWNWRANAIGWMVQHEIIALSSSLRNSISSSNDEISWSRLHFGRDPYNGGGSHLVYNSSSLLYDGTDDYDNVNSKDHDNSTILETRKRTVPAGMLSPANSLSPGVFTERSSLLLTDNHVSFPSVFSKDSDASVRELDWKVSALPLLYTASQGPPRIATMGPTQAKSIAVASARGVCVLDTYHNKWKQFGSPNEERSFSVVSMTWWEGTPKGKKDDERDDLLVAITQTRSGEQFLSCWSSKRLDMMHQLMDTPDLEWKPGESQDPEPSWGIPLPKNIKVTNVSLLSEPESEVDQRNGHKKPRRAIALVYSPDLLTAKCDFLVFQLQVFRNKVSSSHSSNPYIARRPFYVMAQKAIQAKMNHKFLLGPVTSAFIASACFQFDLGQSKRKKSTSEIEEGDFVATIGVVRSPGGLQAMSMFKNGKTCVASLSNFEVSKYQLSDRILSDVLSSPKRTPIVRFVWTIELLNGNVICWSVPSNVGSQPDRFDMLEEDSSVTEETRINLPGKKRPKGLDPPFLICKDDTLGKDERWILGTLCEVGNVSDWAMQSTFGCQFDISLGPVPQSTCGCVLRCGQNSQKLARGQIGGIDNQMFSSNILEITTYSQSPFTITPPAFIISMYALLLEAASIQMDLQAAELSSHVDDLENRLKTVQSQVKHRLTSVRNTDSLMMALRLITFRSLEMMAKTHNKHSKKPSEFAESNLLLSQSLLSTIVVATRRCTSDLQFASLFLEVGRQTEPSNLQHLFPLPLPDELAESKLGPAIIEATSVVDLFTICIDEGSLAASASALPLLTSKAQARYYCELLLDEAIDNFVRNSSSIRCKFDSTEEERRVLGDFFRFGMKLEDAECYEEKLVAESQEGRISPGVTSVNSIDRSISNQSLVPEIPENAQRSLICSLTASSSILNYIVPFSMRGESEKQRMEDAIRREAASFINKSLDEPVLDFALLPDWDDSSDSPNSKKADTNSVAYLVGDALLALLQAENSSNNWKIIAAFAKMILQEGIEIPSSYNLFVEVAVKAQPLDVLSIIPESYDVDNGLEQNMSAYIEEGIRSCCRQITFADANHIIDMSLLLIDRLQLLPPPDIGDQIVMELGLVFIIMVAGEISGRSQSIQDMLEHGSLLNECYKRATRMIN